MSLSSFFSDLLDEHNISHEDATIVQDNARSNKHQKVLPRSNPFKIPSLASLLTQTALKEEQRHPSFCRWKLIRQDSDSRIHAPKRRPSLEKSNSDSRLLHGEQLTGHSDCSIHIPRRRPSLEKGWCSDSRLMYDEPVTQEQRHNAWNKMIEKLTPGVSSGPSKLSPMTKGHMVPLTPTLSQAATLRRVISPSA